ncbi:MAG: ATP-dependent zinc metalloprotease FtsH [Chloroflexi bacterium]|nr:ATP-dependent zinc metalloprotease FtsH [Chloroflexota bacterium]MCI0770241.1 ATP-dependent zinc metalloprotease FtsH [Chloroflexota bacterium]MCI0790169.1 ATP-dependent zinc metalloprotease FtsH [Chloroflexota bacterium]MCI0868074.1 ATP-dependent zinc metalloprotease FtsH [Chloroflexota bacterium]
MNSRLMRNSFIYLLIIVAVLAIFFTLFSDPLGGSRELPISDIVTMAARGDVDRIEVRGDKLTVFTTSGETVTSRKEQDSSIVKILENAGIDPLASNVQIEVRGSSGLGSLFGILINFLPLIFFGAILLFMMRQAQGNSNQTFSFGRSRARMFVGNSPSVSFDDVAGVQEAKEELEEVVEFLKFPERFTSLGAKIPKGVLLVGPPGTGKTLLARAVAGEAEVPFFSISGSEFVEMFVGVGAARVRDLFDQAKRNSPCIVFIDEIDAVGRHRGAGLGGGHDEREQTLNQILVEMDGFDVTTNVIVLAATNRPDILDPALLRPGRFDRRVVLDNPDIRGRLQILEVHSKGKPLADDLDLAHVAKQTVGFSGADLANLANEAAILAARRHLTKITNEEFAESIDRVIAGPARKSRVVSEREKRITAFHEAGHALVGFLIPEADNVTKISIVARGQMGGYTRFSPEEEHNLVSKKELQAKLAVALGGRTAEEIVFSEITTGASNDLEQATQIARAMVTQLGMSEKMGPRTFGKREEMVFLGREIHEQVDYSDHFAEEIDAEVRRFIQEAHDTATERLTENRETLDKVAEYLLEFETAEESVLDELFSGAGHDDEPEAISADD